MRNAEPAAAWHYFGEDAALSCTESGHCSRTWTQNAPWYNLQRYIPPHHHVDSAVDSRLYLALSKFDKYFYFVSNAALNLYVSTFQRPLTDRRRAKLTCDDKLAIMEVYIVWGGMDKSMPKRRILLEWL
jgi:hypothetical protein